MEYAVEHLKSCSLKKFFKQHRSIFAITTETRREWLRVVEDLPEQKIVYVKKHKDMESNRIRNEIKSGLINMLDIIKYIAKLNRNFDLLLLRDKESPQKYNDIRETFEGAFQDVISEISAKDIKYEFGQLRVEKIRNTGTWDVFGTVRVEIPVQCDVVVELEVYHSISHSEVRILKYPTVPRDNMDILNRSMKFITSDSTHESLIGRYVYLSVMNDTEGDIFYRQVSESLKNGEDAGVFLWGILDTDNKKGRLLDALFPHAMDGKMHAMQMTRNVVSSGALDDKATSFIYAPFVLLDGSLRDFKDGLNAWWMQAPKHKVLEWAVYERHINVACYCVHIDYEVREISNRYELLYLLVQHRRMDCIMELVRLYGRSMNILVQILEIGVRHSFSDFADSFFDEIQKEDLEKCEHLVENIEEYLEKRALRQETSQEDIEKIYYWFFCACYLGHREQKTMLRIVSSTYTRVGTDFLYDCIARRCPRFYEILHFYKTFLEFAIDKRVKIRNDVFFMIQCISHALPDYAKEEIEDEGVIYLYGSSEALERYMPDLLKIFENDNSMLEKKVNFTTTEYRAFIKSYLKNLDKNTPQKYMSGVKRVFKVDEEIQNT